MDAQELSSFDKLITPKYVNVLFWVGVATSVLAGLGLVISDLFSVLLGLAVLIAGPVLTRVGCELLVLAFKVVDWVAEIRAMLAKRGTPPRLDEGASPSSAEAKPPEGPSPTDTSAPAEAPPPSAQ